MDINVYHSPMTYFGNALKLAFSRTSLSGYQLNMQGIADSSLINKVIKGERKPSKQLIEKLSVVEGIGLSYDEMVILKMLDEFGISNLKEALEGLQSQGLLEGME